jgi:hypothetical protein
MVDDLAPSEHLGEILSENLLETLDSLQSLLVMAMHGCKVKVITLPAPQHPLRARSKYYLQSKYLTVAKVTANTHSAAQATPPAASAVRRRAGASKLTIGLLGLTGQSEV